MRLLGLFLCFLLPLSAIADDHWILNLRTADGPVGTGFVIGRLPNDRSILLTNHHVIAELSKPIVINGREVEKKSLIGTDPSSDIAAMIIAWTGDIGILSDNPPTVGMKVRSQGKTSGLKSGIITRISRNNAVDWISPETEIAWTNFAARQGDSGGPMVGPDNRVISITSVMTDLGGVAIPPGGGTTVKHIRSCLLRWGWKCQNGKCIRIEPPPRQPITPQPPPAKWEPIAADPLPILPSPPTNSAEIERIFDRLDEIAARIEDPPTSAQFNDSKLINDINAISKATMTIGKRIDQIQAKSPNDPIETNKGSGIIFGLPWGMILAGAASAAGVGLPIWAVMAWRGARAAKQFRNRDIATSGENRTIVVDAPPARNRTFESTQFVNVESDHHRSAYEWAKGHTVRRYPGSQEIFASNDSLIGQYITATLKG